MASAPQCKHIRYGGEPCWRFTTRESGLCYQHDPAAKAEKLAKKDAQLRELDAIADAVETIGLEVGPSRLMVLAARLRRVRRDLAGEPPLTPPQPQE